MLNERSTSSMAGSCASTCSIRQEQTGAAGTCQVGNSRPGRGAGRQRTSYTCTPLLTPEPQPRAPAGCAGSSCPPPPAGAGGPGRSAPEAAPPAGCATGPGGSGRWRRTPAPARWAAGSCAAPGAAGGQGWGVGGGRGGRVGVEGLSASSNAHRLPHGTRPRPASSRMRRAACLQVRQGGQARQAVLQAGQRGVKGVVAQVLFSIAAGWEGQNRFSASRAFCGREGHHHVPALAAWQPRLNSMLVWLCGRLLARRALPGAPGWSER